MLGDHRRRRRRRAGARFQMAAGLSALRAFSGHSGREARCPSLWAVSGALMPSSEIVGAAGSQRTEPNLAQIVSLTPRRPQTLSRFSDPSQPSKSRTDTLQVPSDACRSIWMMLVCRRRYRLSAAGAVAKSASVRAPWAKLHGRIAVICLPASTASRRTALYAPNCKDRAKHNGQAAGLHTCHEQLELQESCQPCLATATKPAARPARNRER